MLLGSPLRALRLRLDPHPVAFRITCENVTNSAAAEAAARSAVARFGRIDVLVNNAANFYAGYLEELAPDQMDRQLAATLIGPMNVTRAVLPVMRKQCAGHIITISSSAAAEPIHWWR